MNDIIEQGPIVKVPLTPAVITPMDMLQIAVEKGADLDQMQKLMDLQERWEKNEARKAYVAAMTAFKADPPKIIKNNLVDYGKTHYKHATLDHVSEAISKSMGPHGLSFTWRVEQNGSIKVTCVVTHCLGHSERVSLSADSDTSGSKNSIQAIGSTVTYLQRYTLLAATGLAASDDDGKASEPVEYITEAQVTELTARLDESSMDETRWLKHYKLDSLSDVKAKDYDKAIKSIKK